MGQLCRPKCFSTFFVNLKINDLSRPECPSAFFVDLKSNVWCRPKTQVRTCCRHLKSQPKHVSLLFFTHFCNTWKKKFNLCLYEKKTWKKKFNLCLYEKKRWPKNVKKGFLFVIMFFCVFIIYNHFFRCKSNKTNRSFKWVSVNESNNGAVAQ